MQVNQLTVQKGLGVDRRDGVELNLVQGWCKELTRADKTGFYWVLKREKLHQRHIRLNMRHVRETAMDLSIRHLDGSVFSLLWNFPIFNHG